MGEPETFDVIVIGAGPAGETVVGRCAENGLKVAVVERKLVGGECSYWGCIPSKVLVRPGDVLAAARRVPGAASAVTGGVQELLHSATIAIAGQVSVDRLWRAVPSFPTVSEVWLRLLETYGL